MTRAAPERRSAPSSSLTELDVHLFNEGTHTRLYDRLGAHLRGAVCQFAVWAPSAEDVSVIGDFNDWTPRAAPLHPHGSSGIWEGEVGGLAPGARYKYCIQPRGGGPALHKADPFATAMERPPATASLVWPLDYDWRDAAWMAERARRHALSAPMSIYEVHLGSWRRDPARPDEPLSYRDVAPMLADYAAEHGFTHVELLPIMEHPFYGSWGYQITGYFAATARYGSPQDLMFLIDTLHQRGVGVILDWVPSHFPDDPHGLARFDGSHLYEHADPRQGVHADWGSLVFNYGRHEVRSFLLSNALFWLDRYHADGLRVDAVASMLYLDYSRKPDEWVPNEYGGRENLQAIELLRRLNETVYREHPDVHTIAEESTAWPMVSRPTHVGGLGFGLKWDMGWMHDTLRYLARDPVFRHYHQDELTFRSIYAGHENFVLPLSHDEVVHGKGSLAGKMPGDHWQQLANLRLLLAYMFGVPGKKLLFQGGELGQWSEWNHDRSLDWHLLDHEPHAGVQRLVGDLNRAYRDTRALHELDCDPRGFAWIDASDVDHSVLAFERRSADGHQRVACVYNFTPVPRFNYRIGVDRDGPWYELVNTDAAHYGGGGHGNLGAVEAAPVRWHGRPLSVTLTLPPLGGLLLRGGDA